MLKALMESICMEIRNNISSFEKYVPTDRILINGGLSKSESFNQMQADVYGKRVVRMDNEESTAVGALMVAAVAMKEYRTMKEAFLTVRGGAKRKEYLTREENHVIYEKLKEEMGEIYQKMKEFRKI